MGSLENDKHMLSDNLISTLKDKGKQSSDMFRDPWV